MGGQYIQSQYLYASLNTDTEETRIRLDTNKYLLFESKNAISFAQI